MPNGSVKFFNAVKGFGFITADEGGKDVFVPAGSVTASGMASLNPGQRVSFEVQPDARGPKAINLRVLAYMPPPPAPVVHRAPVVHARAAAALTIYLDPNCGKAQMALDGLRAAGESPHIVNYIASPPSRDELKSLSMLLRDAGQNLVRKYDPLFQELRLDDRFISDAEFWGGIFENPSLINGPVVVGGGKAAICRTENAVEAFLTLFSGKVTQQPAKPKGLPGAILDKKTEAPAQETIKVPVKTKKTSVPFAIAKASGDAAKARVKPKAKPRKKAVPKLVAKPRAKVVTKASPKKAAKKIVRKVAKKKVKPKSR